MDFILYRIPKLLKASAKPLLKQKDEGGVWLVVAAPDKDPLFLKSGLCSVNDIPVNLYQTNVILS